MADKKTSEESTASALGGTELIPAVQAGADVKLTPDQISTLVLSKAALAELIRDVIAAALVEGANITITPSDGSDTIEIAASGGGGGGGSPGGDDYDVQVNVGGAFVGTSKLQHNPTSGLTTIHGQVMPSAGNSWAIGDAGSGQEFFSISSRRILIGHSSGMGVLMWGGADGRVKVVQSDEVTPGILEFKLPTTDPAKAGVLWNNSGTITISAG